MALADVLKSSKLLSKYDIQEGKPEKRNYNKGAKKPEDPKLAARVTFLNALEEQICYHAAKSAGTEATFTVKRAGKGKEAVELKRFWWDENRGRYFVFMKFGPGSLNDTSPFVARDFAQVGEILTDIKSEVTAGIFDDVIFEKSEAMKAALAAGRAAKAGKDKLAAA